MSFLSRKHDSNCKSSLLDMSDKNVGAAMLINDSQYDKEDLEITGEVTCRSKDKDFEVLVVDDYDADDDVFDTRDNDMFSNILASSSDEDCFQLVITDIFETASQLLPLK